MNLGEFLTYILRTFGNSFQGFWFSQCGFLNKRLKIKRTKEFAFKYQITRVFLLLFSFGFILILLWILQILFLWFYLLILWSRFYSTRDDMNKRNPKDLVVIFIGF